MTYHAKELVSPAEVNIIKVLSDGSALLLLETLWGEAIAMMKVVLTALGRLLSGRSSNDVRPWSVRGLGKSAQYAAWPAGNRAIGRVGNRLLSGVGHRGSLSLAEKAERIKKASSRSLATGTVLYFCYSWSKALSMMTTWAWRYAGVRPFYLRLYYSRARIANQESWFGFFISVYL